MSPEELAMMEAEAGGAGAPVEAQGGGSPEEMIMQNNQMLQEIGQMVQEIGMMLQESMGGGAAAAEEVGMEEGAVMEDEALRQEAMARLAQQG
jgi:hypothetical protein